MSAGLYKPAIAFGLIILSKTIQAQPFVDVASLQYQIYQPVNHKTSSGRLLTHQTQSNIFLPLELKSKNFVIVGGGLNRYKFDLDNSELSSKVSAFSLNLGGIKQWEDGKWSMLFMLIPKISSDFKSVSSDHFQMGGVVLASRKKSDQITWKIGLYYNREYFGNLFVPLLGMDWKVNDRLNIYGVVPNAVSAEYKIHNKLYAGYTFKSFMGTYRLSEDNQQYYIRDGHRIWGHMQNKLFLNVYPTKNIVLFVEAGATLARRVEMYENGSQNKKIPLTTNPMFGPTSDGAFVNIGSAYRIRFDN